MQEKRNATRILVEKREGNGQLALANSRPRLGDNIKMNLAKVGWNSVDPIHLVQHRGHVAGFCEKGNDPAGSIQRG